MVVVNFFYTNVQLDMSASSLFYNFLQIYACLNKVSMIYPPNLLRKNSGDLKKKFK